jgi:hypothetical protein
MKELNLVLTIPQGAVMATGLGLEELAWHLSPGSGRHFRGRSIFIDLALEDNRPAFAFLDEGKWRDAMGDTIYAIEAVLGGKRTKTALSNDGVNIVPVTAWRSCSLVKTGGQMATLEPAVEVARYSTHECDEAMSPAEIAAAISQPEPGQRNPRLLALLAPVELLVMTNLTPAEYGWYATHRRGKLLRQLVFAELRSDQTQLAARNQFDDARSELSGNPRKKTKSISRETLLNGVPFQEWVGYGREAEGGLYVGDRNHLTVHRFPEKLPTRWEKAD